MSYIHIRFSHGTRKNGAVIARRSRRFSHEWKKKYNITLIMKFLVVIFLFSYRKSLRICPYYLNGSYECGWRARSREWNSRTNSTPSHRGFRRLRFPVVDDRAHVVHCLVVICLISLMLLKHCRCFRDFHDAILGENLPIKRRLNSELS